MYCLADPNLSVCIYCSGSILLLSCHQTSFFHFSTHFLAFYLRLNFRRSSKVQGYVSNGHCKIYLVDSLACCVSVKLLPSLSLLLATCNTSAFPIDTSPHCPGNFCCCYYLPTPTTLASGGVRSSRLRSTS